MGRGCSEQGPHSLDPVLGGLDVPLLWPGEICLTNPCKCGDFCVTKAQELSWRMTGSCSWGWGVPSRGAQADVSGAAMKRCFPG